MRESKKCDKKNQRPTSKEEKREPKQEEENKKNHNKRPALQNMGCKCSHLNLSNRAKQNKKKKTPEAELMLMERKYRLKKQEKREDGNEYRWFQRESEGRKEELFFSYT